MECIKTFQFPSGKISYLTLLLFLLLLHLLYWFQFPSGKISYLTISYCIRIDIITMFQFPSGKISYLTFNPSNCSVVKSVYVSIPLREDILSNLIDVGINPKKVEKSFNSPQGRYLI